VNPIFIITLAPVFGWIWLTLGSRNPSVAVKFGLGLVFLGLGFLVMAWAAVYATPVNGVSPMWLVVAFFFHTSGELCLSPIGLSAVTKLAPKVLVGRMMGVWFMGTSLGNLIAGRAAGLMEELPLTRLFGTVAVIVLGAGMLYIVLRRPISRLSQGVE
jgi:POT family proton-dependent oligopeptide transporter